MHNTENSAVLLKYRSDGADGTENFDRYSLENVVIREVFAVDSDNVHGGLVTLYFLSDRSICRDDKGEVVSLPRLSHGDMVTLRVGENDEERFRVSEAGYFTGGDLSHVRIKLK